MARGGSGITKSGSAAFQILYGTGDSRSQAVLSGMARWSLRVHLLALIWAMANGHPLHRLPASLTSATSMARRRISKPSRLILSYIQSGPSTPEPSGSAAAEPADWNHSDVPASQGRPATRVRGADDDISRLAGTGRLNSDVGASGSSRSQKLRAKR